MSHQALARKWRPRRFDALVGQEHVRRALQNALTSGRLHHAYLFTGTRGVGKTTLARLLAKALNCEHGPAAEPCGECGPCLAVDAGRFLDLIEVDAASRTGVDDTRDLLDSAQYAPAVGRFKVYLIDEVHMFSKSSFNALLKTLEEPPGHVKFLLATTDPHKLPATVMSRCLQFQLRALPAERIAQHLETILAAEGVSAEPPALRELARAAHGSVRDALSLLDQALAHAGGALTVAQVRDMLGTLDRAHALHLLGAVAAGDASRALAALDEAVAQAADPAALLDDAIAIAHQVALMQLLPGAALPDDVDADALRALAAALDPAQVQLIYQIALNGRRDLALAPDPRIGIEMVLLRWLAFAPAGPVPAPPAPADGQGRAGGAGAAPVRDGAPAAPAAPGAMARAPVRAAAPAAPASAHDVVPVTPAAPLPERPPAVPAALPAAREPAPETPPVPAAAGAGSATAVLDLAGWPALVTELELTGAARALALQTTFVRAQGAVIDLAVDPGARALHTPAAHNRLEVALADRLGSAVRVHLTVADAPLDTPARQAALADQARAAAARAQLAAEPVAQALTRDLGARLVDSSVYIPDAS